MYRFFPKRIPRPGLSMQPTLQNTLLIIPAFNEEASISTLLDEIEDAVPGMAVLIISDGSSDGTNRVVRASSTLLLDLPCNLGVGGAVQAGFQYAFTHGYDFAVRIDADGQHPPSEITKLMDRMAESSTNMVIGSRFLGETEYRSTLFRSCGIRALAMFLSVICRKRVTDPTSGFQLIDRKLLTVFSWCYPSEYPEPEALALIRRQGYECEEVAVSFRARFSGESTMTHWGTLYFTLKVFLALIIDRARPIDPKFACKTIVTDY